jgi:tRNA acetyltransferase TAN1
VGDGHKVDLSGYDLLILVEIYKVRTSRFAVYLLSDFSNSGYAKIWQNIVGMSVVGSDFEKLKRFNLAELRDEFDKKSHKDPETTNKKL